MTGAKLVEYAKTKVGTPYFYGSKMSVLTETFMQTMHRMYPSTVTSLYILKARNKGQVGKVCTDCSGLISGYTKKMLGSSQLYSQAYTRLNIADYKKWASGVVCWRQGHVGVFFWDGASPRVIEAKGLNYGTVVSDFDKTKWTCGLTFSWMTYVYAENVAGNATWKKPNPYCEPMALLKKGSKGEGVMWLQFELNEAGYKLSIDGEFGSKTLKALKDFQTSCKLVCDGICGEKTRAALKNS